MNYADLMFILDLGEKSDDEISGYLGIQWACETVIATSVVISEFFMIQPKKV